MLVLGQMLSDAKPVSFLNGGFFRGSDDHVPHEVTHGGVEFHSKSQQAGADYFPAEPPSTQTATGRTPLAANEPQAPHNRRSSSSDVIGPSRLHRLNVVKQEIAMPTAPESCIWSTQQVPFNGAQATVDVPELTGADPRCVSARLRPGV
ncbi:hypothetical protein G7043_47200 [Lentzea sp. NEAU-D13]|uniref:Uncharacterized protein n=1 Tax=Lentzea alba TaxID=2714351 RepID=A0A7C9VWH3_9PSEU|nr:hypothetical protein [Lentzea alba]NGY66494.1 hypothetical protein [Lentzea alba]